jgi:hypothetical protein
VWSTATEEVPDLADQVMALIAQASPDDEC